MYKLFINKAEDLNNATEYYVVYVIRFTTSKFTGCKVSATTTFAGNDYTSSQVTI